MATPTLIVQGERDEYGTREEVEAYDLSPAIELSWIPDGNHGLVPRKRSGHSEEGIPRAGSRRNRRVRTRTVVIYASGIPAQE